MMTPARANGPGRKNSPNALAMPYLRERPDGCVISIWLQPRASRTTLAGIHGELLKIAVSSPALEDRANKEVIKYLAKLLSVSPGSVDIISGAHSRRKQMLVRGLSASVARIKLGL